MQFSSLLLLLLLALVVPSSFAITYDRYGGSYVPTTQITDYAALDLDQYELNLQLANRKLMPAIHVYREGGFSGSYAVLTLKNVDPNQAVTIPAGAMVVGATDVQSEVMGYIATTKSWPTQTEEVELEVMYSVGDFQDDYLDCQVGGLWHFSEANRKGCFNDEGVITIIPEGQSISSALEFEYFYDTRKDNRNKNTLQKLSTEAAESMILPKSNQYFPEFQAFVDYYGDTDYGDKWVNAAHEKGVTTFSNDRGHADFTIFEERMGTGEAMKKGIAYLHIWMQVVNHLSKSVELCGTPEAVAELDQAVALYTGSLTTDPDETSGILLYGLADVRSHQFKTAGVVGDMDTGTAHVNVEVMRGFQGLQGIYNAQKTSLCGAGVEQTKQAIIDYMRIPLIQGTLRYTFIREFDMHEFNLDDSERTMAESATFAATIIPFVEKCSPSAAKTLHKHTRVHATHTDFATVKRALESTYDCLQVSCELVGGIWDRTEGDYRRGGEPCGHVRVNRSPVASFFKFVAISATLLLGLGALYKYRRVVTRMVLRGGKRQAHATPATFNGNIAAVAEIS